MHKFNSIAVFLIFFIKSIARLKYFVLNHKKGSIFKEKSKNDCFFNCFFLTTLIVLWFFLITSDYENDYVVYGWIRLINLIDTHKQRL